MYKLKILGSVSPYSKGSTNCPGYLLFNDRNNILLDCGSGITRYMNFPNDLNNLSIIISHLHKDHFSDLFSIGYAYQVYKKLGYVKEKPILYLPTINKDEDTYIDYVYLKEVLKDKFNILEYNEKSILKIDDLSIKFRLNIHSVRTYSISLESDDMKVSYTSDTGYSKKDELIGFVKDSDLLIIESSFIKEHKAINDGHLCAWEAATIAKEANIKKLLLTHFWPEEDKFNYLKEAKEVFNNSMVSIEDEIINIQ